MSSKTVKALITRALSIILISALFTSCSKNTKEIVEYYDSQKPKLIYFIKNEDGIKKRVGEKMYYENGTLRYEGKYKNNLRQGAWKYYYENGVLSLKIEYKEDSQSIEMYSPKKEVIVSKKDKVLETAYYPDGYIAMIRIQKGDIIKEFRFYQSYKLFEERNFKDGALDGEVKSFYENGNITSYNFFRQGMQDSVFFLNYEDGKTQVKGKYKNDNKVGIWEYFTQEGQKDGFEEYSEDGSIIKARESGVKFYDKEGNEIKIN